VGDNRFLENMMELTRGVRQIDDVVEGRADNGSVGHGSNGSANVTGSRGSQISAVKHLTHD